MRIIIAALSCLLWIQLPAAERPNLVIFIADDLSYCDLGPWGNPDVRTPHLDRLASEGMKLTRCYTPAPICSPTRLALFTGLYPVKNGGYPNHSAVHKGTQSLVHYLKPLGYRVGIVGKTMFAPEDSFPFDYPKSSSREKAAKKTKPKKSSPDESDEEAADDQDLDFGAIKQYIKQDNSQPFCLVVASHQPHGPWTKGDPAQYQADKISMPPYIVDTPETREERTRYLAEVTFLDQELGRTLKILEASGQADNTLFVFLSEQGSSFPGGKYNLYDVGIRSATVARWPGKIKPGSESDAISSYVDIVPTFVEAAGGKAVAGLDGRSLLPVLTGATKKHSDYVFGIATSLGVKGVTTPYGIRCVRDEQFKLILNLNPENEFPCSRAAHSHTSSWVVKAKSDAKARQRLDQFLHRPALELFDLKKDPWEQTNIASEPAHRKTVARLRRELDLWMKQQGDLGNHTELEAEKRLKKFIKQQEQKKAAKS